MKILTNHHHARAMTGNAPGAHSILSLPMPMCMASAFHGLPL